MSSIKKISGYKGIATRIAAGDLEFFIVAANVRDLEALYNSILEDADPFTPETCSAVVLISAGDLPKLKPGKFTETAIPEATPDEKKQT